MSDFITNNQQLIIDTAIQKGITEIEFQDHCIEYDDYNDCHGDYYDAY